MHKPIKKHQPVPLSSQMSQIEILPTKGTCDSHQRHFHGILAFSAWMAWMGNEEGQIR